MTTFGRLMSSRSLKRLNTPTVHNALFIDNLILKYSQIFIKIKMKYKNKLWHSAIGYSNRMVLFMTFFVSILTHKII